MAWAFGKSFLIALFLTPIVRDIFRAYNIVDRPGLRKVHAYPIPRLGGISIAAAFLIGLAGVLDADSLAWKLLPGAGVIFATGVLDDFFNLPPRLKLVGQVLAACVAFWSGFRVPGPLPVSFVLTIGWLLLTTNAFNLVDGLDGLCAGLAFIATATMFAAGFFGSGIPALQLATLPLAGALLGFLFHNFNRATMFLGDSGALLIGFLEGCYGLLWAENVESPVSMLAPVLAVSIPLLEVSVSIARRFIQQQPIFAADRRHMHHRLLDRGLTRRRSVVMLYLWAASGAILALLLGYPELGGVPRLAVLGIFCVTTWAGIRQLRYPEFEVAGGLLIRGDFQRAMQSKMRVQNLAEALRQAKTEDEWWDSLAGAARDAGWAGAQWLTKDSVRREQVFGEALATWSFQIVLGGEETLRVDGTLPFAETPLDLLGFAEAVRKSFALRQGTWVRAQLS